MGTGATLGIVGLGGVSRVESNEDDPFPLERYIEPLPIPEAISPSAVQMGTPVYEIDLLEFDHSLHPDLPSTTMWGFNAQYPGPTIAVSRDESIIIRFDNSQLPDEHLFPVDERIGGTTPENHPGDVATVPAVRTSIHPHGLKVPPESDGQSDMWISPGGNTGPRYDGSAQPITNRQARMTSMYHDHTAGVTRLNVYTGLVGLYIIDSELEQQLALPSGSYDIPVLLQDKRVNEDGSLEYPDSFVSEFSGDVPVVNGAIWPYLEVEPRRYRFRFLNGANQRTFNLRIETEEGGRVELHQFAPGHGFLEDVVPLGRSGYPDTLTLAPFERADVIVDFADLAGQTLYLMNDAEFPYHGMNAGSDLEEILEVRVTDPSQPPSDPSVDPDELTLPVARRFDEEEAHITRSHTLENHIDPATGMTEHLLNGHGFGDMDAVFEPILDTIEVWELTNETEHSHPIHLHLVTFRVIGRGDNGTNEPHPSDRGLKDTVRVDPGETVRIAVKFDGYTGRYPWHCHALEHEDFSMMVPFRVVREFQTYADSDGLVDRSGVTKALADWRRGEINRSMVETVLDAWVE